MISFPSFQSWTYSLLVYIVLYRNWNAANSSVVTGIGGEAHQDFQTVHSITSYDLELNSENVLEDNVTLLIQAWKARKHPSALDKMIQEMNIQD